MRTYKKGKDSPNFINLLDKRFGSLVAKEYGEFKTKGGKTELRWKCICDCNEISYIRPRELIAKFRTDCRICSRKRLANNQTLPDKLSTLNRIYRTYKKHAKTKNRNFTLQLNEFKVILNKNCHYCGSEPMVYSDDYKRNGIDRIDSDKGYVKDNCVPCCEMCNRAKLDYPVENFLKWVERVYLHQKVNILNEVRNNAKV